MKIRRRGKRYCINCGKKTKFIQDGKHSCCSVCGGIGVKKT